MTCTVSPFRIDRPIKVQVKEDPVQSVRESLRPRRWDGAQAVCTKEPGVEAEEHADAETEEACGQSIRSEDNRCGDHPAERDQGVEPQQRPSVTLMPGPPHPHYSG